MRKLVAKRKLQPKTKPYKTSSETAPYERTQKIQNSTLNLPNNLDDDVLRGLTLLEAALLRRSPTRETYKVLRVDPKLIAGTNIKNQAN